MRRTPLVRRTSLRRSRMKPWRRDEDDKVTPELHAYILDRDRMCIGARYDETHQCMTRFREPHAPDDRRKLSLDHVHDAAMTGQRAKSDKYHLVAACGWANNEGWCSANRDLERQYLAEKEPQ